VPQMLVAYLFSLGKPKQIVFAGDRGSPELAAFLKELHRRFVPDRVVMMADGSRPEMVPVDGKVTAYVCENFTCQLPTTDPAQFAGLLGAR
jgi:uncharacterized protein YyaL (SSP411 family)